MASLFFFFPQSHGVGYHRGLEPPPCPAIYSRVQRRCSWEAGGWSYPKETSENSGQLNSATSNRAALKPEKQKTP
ncbi:hypothetical protein V6N12_006004 [Hibiscus sabdariffa]|uniref:Uncharacterized protein n=1 Tax=Hibiscus sabdariffa TaxID=183260 RepID=A0ABR2EXY9_9ROSI